MLMAHISEKLATAAAEAAAQQKLTLKLVEENDRLRKENGEIWAALAAQEADVESWCSAVTADINMGGQQLQELCEQLHWQLQHERNLAAAPTTVPTPVAESEDPTVVSSDDTTAAPGVALPWYLMPTLKSFAARMPARSSTPNLLPRDPADPRPWPHQADAYPHTMHTPVQDTYAPHTGISCGAPGSTSAMVRSEAAVRPPKFTAAFSSLGSATSSLTSWAVNLINL